MKIEDIWQPGRLTACLTELCNLTNFLMIYSSSQNKFLCFWWVRWLPKKCWIEVSTTPGTPEKQRKSQIWHFWDQRWELDKLYIRTTITTPTPHLHKEGELEKTQIWHLWDQHWKWEIRTKSPPSPDKLGIREILHEKEFSYFCKLIQ